MMDESKRKKIIFGVSVFIAIIIISTIIWFVFFNKNNNLPPEEPVVNESSNETKATTPVAPNASGENPIMIKNGVTFKDFNELSRLSVTDSRIDLIQFYLAEYANAQPAGTITSFTIDKSSIKETKQGEQNIFTFTVTDNSNAPYTVELLYTFATDTYVRIFDKNNTLIEASPYDTD